MHGPRLRSSSPGRLCTFSFDETEYERSIPTICVSRLCQNSSTVEILSWTKLPNSNAIEGTSGQTSHLFLLQNDFLVRIHEWLNRIEQQSEDNSHLSLFSVNSFRCGMDYHAPTDCGTIKKWLTKCVDDSETANYISAHTKDVSRSKNIIFLFYHFLCFCVSTFYEPTRLPPHCQSPCSRGLLNRIFSRFNENYGNPTGCSFTEFQFFCTIRIVQINSPPAASDGLLKIRVIGHPFE